MYYDDARKIEPEKLPDFELLFFRPFHADKQLGGSEFRRKSLIFILIMFEIILLIVGIRRAA